MNLFLPIYAIIQLARISVWQNIEIMWIFMISTFIAIIIGFILGIICIYVFKLDERIKLSFLFVNAYPSLGSLSLVLGNSLCYPGNYLAEDPLCKDMLGYMVMNYLFFQLTIFVTGFLLMSHEVHNAKIINEKLSYLWHFLIPHISGNKNYAPLYFFKKYINKNSKVDPQKIYEKFEEKYKLEMRINSDENDFEFDLIENKSILIFEEEQKLQPEDIFDARRQPMCLHENRIEDIQGVPLVQIPEELKIQERAQKSSRLNRRGTIEQQENIIHNIEEEIDELPIPLDEERRVKINNIYTRSEIFMQNNIILTDQDGQINKKNRIVSNIMIPIIDIEHDIKIEKAFYYYDKMFIVLENFMNNENEVLLKNYLKEKETTINNLKRTIPKFPILKSVQIDSYKLRIVNHNWEIFWRIAKNIDPDFHISNKTFTYGKIILEG
jgi:hypothetical protein